MTIEIVDFPIKNGDFPIAMLVYQRVIIKPCCNGEMQITEAQYRILFEAY
jgi:hypothetical protein